MEYFSFFSLFYRSRKRRRIPKYWCLSLKNRCRHKLLRIVVSQLSASYFPESPDPWLKNH